MFVEHGTLRHGPRHTHASGKCSWDVGVGLNVRRIRQQFLSRFLTTYSLRPIGELGSVFRRFPGPWQVFIEDPSTPGRYNLAAECDSRPAGMTPACGSCVCILSGPYFAMVRRVVTGACASGWIYAAARSVSSAGRLMMNCKKQSFAGVPGNGFPRRE